MTDITEFMRILEQFDNEMYEIGGIDGKIMSAFYDGIENATPQDIATIRKILGSHLEFMQNMIDDYSRFLNNL